MKLEFQNLELEDFKSFTGLHRLDLTKRLPGLHAVRGRNEAQTRLGSNGAGKSSVFDGLCWCLFGRTPDGLRNPDIKPWNSRKEKARVSTAVAVDGTAHVITRTAITNGLQLDGKDAPQEKVQDLIGLNVDLFCHTILMGQSQPLFFDLKPQAKMELFSDVLQLDRWDARAAYASTRASHHQGRVLELSGELTGINSSLDQVQDMLLSIKEKQADWNREQDEKLTRYEESLEEARAGVEKSQKTYDEADLAQESAEVDLKLLYPDIEKARTELDKVGLVFSEARAVKKVLETQVSALQAGLTQFKKEGRCPTCGQSTKGTPLEKHYAKMRSDLVKVDQQIKQLNVEKLRKDVDRKLATLDRYKELDVEFQQKASTARQIIEMLTPVIAKFNATITRLEEMIASVKDEANPYREQATQLRRRKQELTADKREIEADIAKASRLVELTKFWVRGFKDVRLYVIEDVLQELEITTNAVLEEVGLQGWQVHYAVEKETKAGTIQRGLNVTILSPDNREAVRWESWSGGEGQRLRIIGALALSEVLLNYAGVQTDIEILDEPTQHLSTEGVGDLVDFLADRAKQLARRTFYIDHQSIDSARFASTLSVVKDKNGSCIEGEDNGRASRTKDVPRRNQREHREAFGRVARARA